MTYLIKKSFNKSLILSLSNDHKCSRLFSVHISDTDQIHWDHTQYGMYLMSYNTSSNRLRYTGPDWTFVHYPGTGIEVFDDQVRAIMNASQVQPSINKIAWFGNISSSHKGRAEYVTRPMLVEYTKKYPQLFDMRNACWQVDPACGHLSLEAMVAKYAYLLDIGGNGYSGRLKYLLFSRRPLVLVDRKYVEYFHHELIPFYHYIPVNRNLSDLVEKANWIQRYPIQAQQIAVNALNYALDNFTTERVHDRARLVFTRQCDARSFHSHSGHQHDDRSSLYLGNQYISDRYNEVRDEIDNLLKSLKLSTIGGHNHHHQSNHSTNASPANHQHGKHDHDGNISHLLCVRFIDNDIDSVTVSSRIKELKPHCNKLILIVIKTLYSTTSSSQTHAQIDENAIVNTVQAIDHDVTVVHAPHNHHSSCHSDSKLLSMMKILHSLYRYEYVWMIDYDVSFENFNVFSFLQSYHVMSSSSSNHRAPSSSSPSSMLPIIAHPLMSGNYSTSARYLHLSSWLSEFRRHHNSKHIIMQVVKYVPLKAPLFKSQYLIWYLTTFISQVESQLQILSKDVGFDSILCTTAAEFLKTNKLSVNILPCALIIDDRLSSLSALSPLSVSTITINATEIDKKGRHRKEYLMDAVCRNEMQETIYKRFPGHVDYGVSLEVDPLFPHFSKVRSEIA